jgi:hypothetical protein
VSLLARPSITSFPGILEIGLTSHTVDNGVITKFQHHFANCEIVDTDYCHPQQSLSQSWFIHSGKFDNPESPLEFSIPRPLEFHNTAQSMKE